MSYREDAGIPPRRRRALTGVVCLLTLLALVPLSPGLAGDGELSADAAVVLDLVEKRDVEALAAFTATRERDPWRLVDELLAGGHPESASALAAADRGRDAPALRRYAAHPPADDPATRKILEEALDLLERGEPRIALARLEEAVPPSPSVLALRVAILRGRCHYEIDGYAGGCLEECARADGIAGRLGRDLEWEGETLQRRFEEMVGRQDFRGFRRLADRLIEVERLQRRAAQAAMTRANIGSVYLLLALPGEAMPHLREARSLLGWMAAREEDEESRAELRSRVALIDVNLAYTHLLLGDFPVALEIAEGAVADLERMQVPELLSQAQSMLGNVHAAFGGYEEALRFFRTARKNLEGDAEGTLRDRAELRINEGVVLQETGRLREAEEALDAALRDLRELPSDEATSVALISLGEIHEKRGEWGQALDLHRRALMSCGPDRVLNAYARVRLAEARSWRGANPDRREVRGALAEWDRALDLLGGAREPTLRLLARLGQGEAHLSLGAPAEALRKARQAISLLEEMTGGLADGEAVEARGHTDRTRVLALGIRAAVRLEKPEAVLEMIERSRGRAFLTALGGRQAFLRHIADPEQAAELRAARAVLATAYASQRAACAMGDVESIQAVEKDLVDAQRRLGDTLSRLERSAKLRTWPIRPDVASLHEIQGLLGPGEVMVQYVLQPESSCGLVLTGKDARIVALPPRDTIAGACEDLRADADDPDDEFEKRRIRLREILVDRLELPEKTRRLLVVPDGILAHIPWALLVGSRPGRVEVALIPSATTFRTLTSRGSRRGRIRLGLGDPDYSQERGGRRLQVYAGIRPLVRLPESAAEIRAITREGDVRLLGPAATEAGLRRELARRPLWSSVHFACHCILSDRNPAFSALALTPSGDDDGLLTALDVFTMDIRSDLVVLSACQAGQDRMIAGEGMQGLVRAFMVAGTPRVIASLWDVDDAAARAFMQAFYEEWTKPGVSTTDAMRVARMRVAKKWRHRRHWAAWILWGLPR